MTEAPKPHDRAASPAGDLHRFTLRRCQAPARRRAHGGGEALFAIDPETGRLTVVQQARGGSPAYILKVEASDGKVGGFGDVTVGITDCGEAPAIVPGQVFLIAPGMASGESFGRVLAVADGGSVPSAWSYAIVAGNAGDVFAIDPTTGDLAVAGRLDASSASSYGLAIRVSDGRRSGVGVVVIDIVASAAKASLDEAGFGELPA
ncbi:cadherin repeat domain-containing protein [Dokdonella fugitiva]|uniref:Cadherin domain-containing protein n=1 Tax=Dokdonella fugitiva TaxID=328517 RepID=A0A4R2HX67_9GAMM|nr:cadherin repeat domain-containing protein [Dokdonella fugitiva]TCO36084.1 cadherin domain-containing protein [Dokdonella fugitiva]